MFFKKRLELNIFFSYAPDTSFTAIAIEKIVSGERKKNARVNALHVLVVVKSFGFLVAITYNGCTRPVACCLEI